jgi:hypothetical protein
MIYFQSNMRMTRSNICLIYFEYKLSALLRFLLEKQTQCYFLRPLWSLESIPHLRAGILWQKSTTPTTMMTIYEIQHSHSRGKTATYAWKFGTRATTVFYIHESTHIVQAKPQHTLINTIFVQPLNSTLMSLRIQCKWNHNIRLEIRYLRDQCILTRESTQTFWT